MKSENLSLDRQLQTLISRFGYKNVVEALARNAEAQEQARVYQVVNAQKAARKPKAANDTNLAQLISQVTQERANIQPIIEKLCAFYENKSFLPDLRAVNLFLEKHGKSGSQTSRSRALKQVIELLATLQDDVLNALLNEYLALQGNSAYLLLAREILASGQSQ